MRTLRPASCVHLLILLALAPSDRVEAQRSSPPCTLARSPLQDLALGDGRQALVFPEVLSFRNDTLLMLGGGVISDRPGTPDASQRPDSIVAGLLLVGKGLHSAAVIPLPPALRSVRSFRAHPRLDGWDVVFFVPDPGRESSPVWHESGMLWYARLIGGKWLGMDRIGHVTNAMVLRPNTSELLLRDEKLHFVLAFGDVDGPGGFIVWHRSREGQWSADTVATRFGPMSVTTASEPEGEDAGFYVSVKSGLDGFFSADLLWVSAVDPSQSVLLRRSVTGSMNAPVVHPLGDSLHVSWWQGGVNGPVTVWYQPLAARRENPSERNSLVTNDMWQFSFLAVPEGSRTRLVWAYRVPDGKDSVEVAVVANGEPKVIGRMAFPFGFLTNGVASGDRSFILATSPRTNPGAESSASHILEVRVVCREGT